MSPTEPDSPPPSTGLVAGKYELVRLIGQGGMGAVWEGRHTTLGMRVAIKFIDSEYADSREARARFDNEARAAASIQSKHAIQIYDHGVTDGGKPYIVMELLLGEPLDRRIERLGRMPLGETARVLRQVARALQRAHDRGIVHRDLKPENIFLVRTPDEDEEVAKVLDFGIAKFRRDGLGGAPAGVTSSTKTGAVLGTPYYMSPEQARGLRELDYRTDLWSLGVIAFKCVCGALPFEGVSVGDLLVKICTAPPPAPSAMVPGLPVAFDGWFARALQRDPAQRFQSAQDLSDALAVAAGISVRRALPEGTPFPEPRSPATVSDPGMAKAVTGVPPTRAATPAPGLLFEGGSIPPTTSGGTAMSTPGAVSSPPRTAPPLSATPYRPARTSPGVVVASVAAALVGVALGVTIITKWTGGHKASSGPPAVTTAMMGHAGGELGRASAAGGSGSGSSEAPRVAPTGTVGEPADGHGLGHPGKTGAEPAPVVVAPPHAAPRPSDPPLAARDAGAREVARPPLPPSPQPAPQPAWPSPPPRPAPTVIDPGY